jgi:colanic acid biosynthesis glycosyl transferase WcaI
MRILLLSQWFFPEPQFKGLPFAKELVRRGHKVQVLTGFPNYPGGKLYPGYRVKILQREIIEGIPIIRVPLYPSHDNSAIRRVFNYVSFAISAALLGCLLVRKADVLYAYHPPATVALPALLIGAIRRIPVVYDIQDLWPDTLEATGMVHNRQILRIVGSWCRMTYRRVRRIVVLSPGFKSALMTRGVPAGKIDVVYNWYPEDELTSTRRDEVLAQELGMAGKFNVVFAGTMGRAQGLDTVLAAAGILKTEAPNVQLIFVGGGIDVERLKGIAEERRLTNVKFLARRPRNEIGAILGLADVLLVHLRKDPLFRITIPSKIQAYLAAGKPILAGVEGDAADIVKEAEAGLICDSDSPGDLAVCIGRFAGMTPKSLEELGQNGLRFYMSEMSFEKGMNKFEEVFGNAAATS